MPLKPEVSPLATFASAKPGQAKLSIGSSRAQRSASERTVAPQAVALEQQLAQAKAGQKGAALKWVKIGAGVLVVAVGGLVGYPYLRDWMVQRDAAAKSASASTTQPPAATAEPAAPVETPVEKEQPLLPPVWTLDVGQARIPESNANGMFAGTNFVVETARLDSMPGNTYLLRLVEGPLASPARAFMVYLRLNAGESILDRSWTISPDMKGKHVPQVVNLWRAAADASSKNHLQPSLAAYFSLFAGPSQKHKKRQKRTQADNLLSRIVMDSGRGARAWGRDQRSIG